MSQSLETRAESVLHWLRLLPATPSREAAIGFIQELLGLTFRLERERDDALKLAAPDYFA